MASGQGLSALTDRVQRWSLPVRIAAAGGALALLATFVFVAVALGGGEGEPEFVAQPVTPTPTASPTPTPTPSPTPTPPPPYPWPAERIPLGQPLGLVNATSIGFPEPPPTERVPPGNAAGVVRIVSEALGMDHYVETLGIENGRMLSPDEDGNHSVGWYASDDRWTFGTPGEAGNSIFSAHETWNHLQGPFYEVHRARPGDEITLVMEDGEQRHYQVASITRYPVGEMPMKDVLWPSDRPEHEEWITLYTCGGEIIYDASGYGDYLARDVLVAKWVGSTLPGDEPTASETPAGPTANYELSGESGEPAPQP